MIITGSVLLIEPGTSETVIDLLKGFPEVTCQATSQYGAEIIINLEADDHFGLEELCSRLKQAIPQIVDVAHVYVNFDEETGKTEKVKVPRSIQERPEFKEPQTVSADQPEKAENSTEVEED